MSHGVVDQNRRVASRVNTEIWEIARIQPIRTRYGDRHATEHDRARSILLHSNSYSNTVRKLRIHSTVAKRSIERAAWSLHSPGGHMMGRALFARGEASKRLERHVSAIELGSRLSGSESSRCGVLLDGRLSAICVQDGMMHRTQPLTQHLDCT